MNTKLNQIRKIVRNAENGLGIALEASEMISLALQRAPRS